MAISLVILAAGMGSRFGGVKQLAPVGPHGELIIDYSIHDAVAAGFRRLVFILRRDIVDDFHEVIGDRLEKQLGPLGVRCEYVIQELTDPPEGRTKPWGTGQALLACREALDGPFAVINSDDYYGREAYEKAYAFLAGGTAHPSGGTDGVSRYGMVGFVLKNTLSEHGGVTRGVCRVDGRGALCGIDETRGIVKTPDGAAVEENGGLRRLDVDAIVSMNLWLFTPELMDVLGDGFAAFRRDMSDPLKDEYLLPDIVDRLLREGRATVDVLRSDDRWFGVTYREDLPAVQEAIRALYERGTYQPALYADIDVPA